ncbi:uncharacterized protein LOC131609335 [Vicia villosa]|uniref:uncharacterized protein LOC131609335 n=1 Tax=Vicia villosa TaxID=3911 RepID=UPI00273C9EAC|nr:uncharacterized protein LOC131609335 [Vicia villosa]
MWSDFDIRPEKDKGKKKISSKSGMEFRNRDKSKRKSVIDHSQQPQLETLGEILKRGSINECSTQHEELVKHMSNLPGYLKSSDRGKNIQEKALNFGVLDWSRLEKWKNKQAFNGNEESSSSRAATTSSSTARRHKKFDDKKGLCSSRDIRQYRNSGKKIIGGERRMRSREFESIGEIQLDKSLRKGKMSDYEVEAISMQGFQKKKETRFNSGFDNRFPSLEGKDKSVTLGSEKKMSSRRSEAKIKMNQWPDSDIEFDQNHCHIMPRDIVLLRPRKFLQSNFEDYFPHSQSIASSDENFSESSLSSSSYISLPEEAYTENILPSVASLASETTRDNFDTDLDVDFSSVRSEKPGCSKNMSSFISNKDTCIEKEMLDMKQRNQYSFGNMKELTENNRNNLSQDQLSFGLNRLGRSLSFKEGPTLPKQSAKKVSAKSGPLIFENSNLNKSSKDHKASDHKRTRSSTFMRLLDPLWKHKASNTQQHSSEISLTPKGSPNSMSFRTNSLHDENHKESSIKAILQLTIKNGLPLFHFVINSERKVLAATMNSLASSEKDDGSCYFTFYLLNEIKKKSGRWTSHWSKEKNSGGYAYNIAGHMKISNSRVTEPKDENFKGQCMVKDYVLFGVGNDQPDKGPKDFVKRKELAAAVIEIPCENVNLLKKECLKCLLADKRCFCISQENDISGSNITVILPGGLHASPKKGEPSPLIHRWKLGGLCDCGGWDVGCKLLVLSNQNPSSKPHLERFQLFVQEGTEEDTPLFIMEPLKDGFYSVEFSSTIPHLQAFFISVSVLSSKKLPSSMEIPSKELNSKEEASKYYNSGPPLSPVDRV